MKTPYDIIVNEKIASFNKLSKSLNSQGIPFQTLGSYSIEPANVVLRYSVYSQFDWVCRWVFYLKDFGLEYIYPFKPDIEFKTNYPSQPKLVFGDNIDVDVINYLACKPLHISEFQQLCPSNLNIKVLKSLFPFYFELLMKETEDEMWDQLNEETWEEKQERWDKEEQKADLNILAIAQYREYNNSNTFSQETLDFGFEGDPDNYWNID